ncbi:hypothetical protein EC9_21650 [Rosistilla ulvae]|uniref:Nickel uptake substrate-specific transmembrane region n=1 Tax=Rosistilla ulvae TaxID=1930277 RepID=A0A517LZD8_9BACT|nr:carboxypeptidase-like regulatory domain-containing protein [Rosistilla ulvae]QDS87980.1 hypothetical protein EC9_21650 [Rosistilla ulvae]
MRNSKLLKTIVTIVTCAAIAVPHPAMAASRTTQIVDGVKVSQDIKNVRLGAASKLRGAIVDHNGRPVAGAPVVVGQQGKIVAQLDTAADGRYEVADVAPGIYQVASYAGVQTVRLHAADAPAGSVEGVVQVIDSEGISRGQSNGRFSLLKRIATNPLTWAVVIAAAIAIPLALDDNDDAS